MEDEEKVHLSLKRHGYEPIKTIGKGSFAQVYLCKSTKYDDLFAAKVMNKSFITNLEIQALKSLWHPYIIKMFEILEDDDLIFLILEYCDGGNMEKLGALDYNMFIYYSKQILEALNFCHSKSIAHRDIKPSNIYIDKYYRIRLADFGFAKKFEDQIVSKEKCGSIMFAAPEIFKGQFNPFKADIWALGVTFFYMITGKYPFNINSRTDISMRVIDFSQYTVDKRIQQLILKMTSIFPDQRPTALKLLADPLFKKQKPKKMDPLLFPARLAIRKSHSTSTNLPTSMQQDTFLASEDELGDDAIIPLKKVKTFKSVAKSSLFFTPKLLGSPNSLNLK